jgi:hypothetical protein
MLFISTLTSERALDPELWAVVWQAKAPPTLKLLGAYNLSDNRRIFIWEGETAADLQFMDVFNEIGVLQTTPAFDRTKGWQFAFAGDIEGFRANLEARVGPGRRLEAAIDLRTRGLNARTTAAARKAAREWAREQGEVGGS